MEASVPAGRPAAPAQPYGEVFDLGYQHYTGPRLGRPHAMRALIWYSIKRGLGIRKRWTAKIMPALLYISAFLPAVIVVAILAFVESNVPGEQPVTFGYDDLNEFIQLILFVFAAATAPEMLCDDRRENVLLIYFSRAITRLDYLTAKIIALALLMATIAFGPALVLFAGKTLLDDSPLSYFADHVGDLGRIAVYGTLISAYWAAIGLGIAAFTNRKGVAAAIFIGGGFIVTGLANALFEALDNSPRRYLLLVSPLNLVSALSHWLFDSTSNGNRSLEFADVPGIALVAGVLAVVGISALIMYRRYLADE